MSATDRLHSLDALRAFALLLGLLLHGALPYLPNLPAGGWVWKDDPSLTLAWTVYLIHLFRMPLFFLLAGFFGRMLLERRGMRAFARDRATRIGIPLVAGLPLVYLLIGLGLALGAAISGLDVEAYFAEAGQLEESLDTAVGIPLIHLWFLYYLLIFYACALGLRLLPGSRAGGLGAIADRAMRLLPRGLYGVLLPALPLVVLFSLQEDWVGWMGLPAPLSLQPELQALAGYGLPFALGWLAQRQSGLLLALAARWQAYLALALVLAPLGHWLSGPEPVWLEPFARTDRRLLFAAVYFTGQWSLILGLTGAAVRFLSAPRPALRYLADASYWIYLMHVPTLAFFHAMLGPLPWHWSAEYVLALGGCLLLMLSSYHVLVRFTWLGALLNGRRRSRSDAAAARIPAP